jgi:predicted nucleic acid-binding protein
VSISSTLADRGGTSNIQFSDALILETAKKHGHHPLATFDTDLGKLEGTQRLKP